MIPIVRYFATEQAAHDAVANLVNDEIPRQSTSIILPNTDGSSHAVDAAIHDDVLPAVYRNATLAALAKGHSVVCVTAPFAMSSVAEQIMDSSGAVDTDSMPNYTRSDPAPFSDFLGLPVLTEGKSHLKLTSSNFTFSSMLGMGLLSKKAAPLSSMFGMKTLSTKTGSLAAGSAVQRMSGTPAPLSSKLGMKLLSTKKGSGAKGSAVERMSGNAAPFSSFLGLRVLSRRK